MANKIITLSSNVDKREKYSADLEQALAVAGTGCYNLSYCLVLALLLDGAIIELIGYSITLPAAVCDLDMTEKQRGFVSSVPYIGIIVSSYAWGYLVDTKGRKRMIIYSSMAAGFFSTLSALMPNLTTFTICKLLTSLCIPCPTAVPFIFMGEILPARSRDIVLSFLNSIQIAGSSIIPLFAWAVIPLDFRVNFGMYDFRPWRLLVILYSLLLIIPAIIMSYGPESPKYLVSQGKNDEALNVLQKIYAGNKGKRLEDYPIKNLIVPADDREKGNFLTSLKVQTLPLLSGAYLKWMLLNGFLLFGMFSILNGLYLWVPDVLNRVLTGSEDGKTACQIIADRFNQTSIVKHKCDDSIDKVAIITNLIAQLSCTLIAAGISMTIKFVGKKNLIIACFFIMGIICILINFTTNSKLFAVLMSSFPLLVLAMGPVNAFAIEIFPTHLRGMAVALSMMFGRMGAITGTNVAGLLIHDQCDSMFYFFGALLLLCGMLSFILPHSNASEKDQDISTHL